MGLFDDDYLKDIRAFSELLHSPALQSLREHQKLAADILGQSALVNALREAQTLAEQLRASPAIQAIREAQERAKHLLGQNELFASLKAVQEAFGKFDPTFSKALEPFGRYEEHLDSRLPPDFRTSFNAHLARVAFPSLGLLSEMRDTESILSIPDSVTAATLIGIDSKAPSTSDVPTAAIGMFTHADAEQTGPVLTVKIVVQCTFCENPMPVVEQGAKWIGDNNLLVHASAFPVCTKCLGDEPQAYVANLAERLKKPSYRFEVIDGEGQGGGGVSDRSHLRLVKKPPEDEPNR